MTLLDLAIRELAEACERVACCLPGEDGAFAVAEIARDIRRGNIRIGIEDAMALPRARVPMVRPIQEAASLIDWVMSPSFAESTTRCADTILCHALRLTVEPAYRADVAAEMWRALGGEEWTRLRD